MRLSGSNEITSKYLEVAIQSYEFAVRPYARQDDIRLCQCAGSEYRPKSWLQLLRLWSAGIDLIKFLLTDNRQ